MNRRNDDAVSWIIILIAFAVFWPAGVFLLLRRLVNDNGRRGANGRQENDANARYIRYKQIVSGKSAMPIAQLASAAGVSYETALRELGFMVSQKMFTPDAYINYMTKTLVLHSGARAYENVPEAAYTPVNAKDEREGSGSSRKNSGYSPKSARRSVKENSGRGLSIIGILLIIFGAFIGTGSAGMALAFSMNAGLVIWMALTALFCIVGGIAALASGKARSRRSRRFAKYLAVSKGKGVVDLSFLARIAGVSEDKVARDLEIMIEKGYFNPTSYVDRGLRSLIITPDARPEYTEPEPEQEPKSQYASILQEIRDLNDRIDDEAVSKRIYEIEGVTAKIFRIVEEKPEKLPEIKSFMSYYLPTTLKLLNSYATFEEQGITGDNIDSARREIEKTLDMLVLGFSQQLDRLFSADMLDITSDIEVLESMMKKDGLDGKNDFQVSGGH